MEDNKNGNGAYVPHEPMEKKPIHHLPEIYENEKKA